MDMDWPRVQNTPNRHPHGWIEMDTNWKQEEEQIHGDMETLCGEGDERKRMDMGTSSALVPRQTGMEVYGDGLMCIPARRGLSKLLLSIESALQEPRVRVI